MRKIMILASLVFAASCGKGGLDGKLDELSKIKDEVCACKDKACAEAGHEKYIAWKKGNSKDDKPSDDQMKKFDSLRKELNDCRHKFDGPGSTGETTGTPPAPAGSAAPATP